MKKKYLYQKRKTSIVSQRYNEESYCCYSSSLLIVKQRRNHTHTHTQNQRTQLRHTLIFFFSFLFLCSSLMPKEKRLLMLTTSIADL